MISFFLTILSHGTKGKTQYSSNKTKGDDNPKTYVTLDLDHMPLANQYFKIVDTKCEFDLFELHHWLKKNCLD